MAKVVMLSWLIVAVTIFSIHASAKSKGLSSTGSALEAQGDSEPSNEAIVETQIREPLDDEPPALSKAESNAEKDGVDQGANWHNIKMTKSEKDGLITLSFKTQTRRVLSVSMATLAEIEMAKSCRDNFEQELFKMAPKNAKMVATAITKFRCVSASTKGSFSADEHFKSLCGEAAGDDDPVVMLLRLCENRLDR